LQVRCRDSELCSAAGAKVVVTDQARTSNRTALVLSAAAYAAMASAGKAARLRDRRVVDVEYKRYLGAATQHSASVPRADAAEFFTGGRKIERLILCIILRSGYPASTRRTATC
jgi:hypothetical protein